MRLIRTGVLLGLVSLSAWLAAAPAPTRARADPLAAPVAPPEASSPVTGNLLVALRGDRSGFRAAAAAVEAIMASVGARPSGRSVLQIGLITVRPPAGLAPAAFATVLRRLPGVATVELEHRLVVRDVPNDPALSTPDPHAGTGVSTEWELAREGFYRAWSITHGNGALVGVIDTGIDGAHPDLASKIATTVDQQPGDSTGPPNTDQVGHGTHVASLACADTGNGIGLAGAGYNCRLVVEKSDFSDSSIAAALVDATDRGVQAINMSFGPATPTSTPPPDSEVRALDYAAAHGVVLVAAAADTPGTEQGDPANVLQPAGTGSQLPAGIGLDVTAADYTGARASFAGYGSEISLAAYGALNPDAGLLSFGSSGLFGAFPANATQLEALPTPCGCRTTFQGSNDYAYLQGTSMAAPQVAATAAMMKALNPTATLEDVLVTLKRTARRPAGSGWTSALGWGILDAGAALDAIRRIDREPPVTRIVAPGVSRRRAFTLGWRGQDPHPPGVFAPGIAYYLVYVRAGRARERLLARTTRHSLRFVGRPGARYTFDVVAVDRAGRRQRRPAVTVTRVVRGAR
ncbi:MAG: S8 family peptidase [Solirubrobacteraceae bacterium]